MSKRKFYVFFRLNSQYENKFAVVQAKKIDDARTIALQKFGVWNVGGVTGQEEYALNKIKLHGYTEVKEQ